MSPFMEQNDSDAHDNPKRLGDIVLLRQLWPYIRPQWRLISLTAILLPCISLTQVVQPLLLKAAIDGPIHQHQFNGLLPLAGLFLLALGLHYAFRYWQMILAQVLGQRIVLGIRTALYAHLQNHDTAFYLKHPLGKLVTRVSSDVENISEVFATGGVAIFSDFAVIIGILITMFILQPVLAIAVLVMIPVVIFTIAFFRDQSRSAYDTLRVQLARLNIHLSESLTGMEVIQLTGRQADNLQRFSDTSRTYQKTSIQSVTWDSAFTAVIEQLSYFTILGVFAVFLFWKWQQPVFLTAVGVISFGSLVAFIQYIQMLYEPVEELSDKFTVIQSGLASVEKIMELMAVAPQIMSPQNPIMMTQPVRGEITFQDVTFGYDPERPVLNEVSLTIQAGEKVALVGPTGAGKSTLIKLLTRQYDPQAGQILIDGIDHRSLELAFLRQSLLTIPQEDFIFNRSLLENITLSDHVDEARFEAVLAQTHLTDLVQSLPEGRETILAERGRSLSNGERQLLIFARALYHDPPVLILDEATAAIDPQTEARIQATLEATLKHRTAIIIAHRLSTIQFVDRVLEVNGGRIRELSESEKSNLFLESSLLDPVI